MNKTVKYMIMLLLTFTLITMPLTIPLFKSSTQYSMFNNEWNGLSKFAKLSYTMGKKVVPIFESFDITNISERTGVLLIIGPNMTFTGDEIGQVKGFLERGNTLVIADDFGTGNEILRGLKVPVGISKYPLQDFFYEEDDRLIVAVRITDPFLARNVTKIVTNEPSGIIVTRKGEAYTSRVAMINMHKRMFPIITETKYGNGRVVVISDPDIFTNMQFEENRQFLENLIQYLGGDTFYFDEAHHPDFNLYTAGTVTITRVLPKEKAIRLILGIALIILLWEVHLIHPAGRRLWVMLLKLLKLDRKPDLVEVAASFAKKNGWDVQEVMEMLERMGD